MQTHENLMRRCLELARLGFGMVAPNPMVGALLVREDRILSEGYHRKFGGAHAEIDCLNRVKESDRHLIAGSTMYVSLEPCSHTGKTPPCADALVRAGIGRVVIAMRDPNEQVNGLGIARLKQAGIEVVEGILESDAKKLNERFVKWHRQRRPWVILKWAQTKGGKVATADRKPVRISNSLSDRLVHRWRTEEASILVGTTTALHDNPSLTNRLWSGGQPIRMVVDRFGKLPATLNLFDGKAPTIIFTETTLTERSFVNEIESVQLDKVDPFSILNALYTRNIPSVIIEGGPVLLQAFIESGCWDEARIITGGSVEIPDGCPAPNLDSSILKDQFSVGSDLVSIFRPKKEA
jgi:diaminohydroxyphosphoribosylaminopyrimidine deaminase/5-amino-6-(5-phosphoribosylamino)uracil reductase